jgi:trehalose-6-phosphate synthase
MTELSYVWVGWPGVSATTKSEQDEITSSLETMHCYPVFLTEKEMDKFYLAHLYQFLTKSPQKQSFFTYKPYLNRV